MISFRPGYYGWLGNQMFQYAATRALAIHKSTHAVFPRNKPDLHLVYRLQAQDKETTEWATGSYQEPHFHFDGGFWRLPDSVQLSGYFQSERYFKPHADQLRREFTFRLQPRPSADGHGLVGIHVRRGDYVRLADHHPPCTMHYYETAMRRFRGAQFLVVSDDIEWCRLNFRPQVSRDIVFAHGSALEDFAALLTCDHHIIANSSFSWWAAYLGGGDGHRVIAPRQWFGPAKAGWDTRDLYVPGWEVI